jgi:hypothetical protein
VPAVSPETVIGEEPLVPVSPPGLEVAVYVDTAAPPVALAVNGTDAVVPERVTVPMVGACGTVVAVIELDAFDAEDVPAADVAVTVNV